MSLSLSQIGIESHGYIGPDAAWIVSIKAIVDIHAS